MAKAEDLTGKEFNFLKVIERAPDRVAPSGQKRKFWLCECMLCGTRKEIAGADLKSGRTKSCGCWQVAKGKAARNVKICVECGKAFECPPSDKTVTCSPACRSAHASKSHTGKKMRKKSRAKISAAAQGRDMVDLQKMATDAAKESPKSGRFETNINAKDWHLISPDGEDCYFHSLNFWLRENCRELFDCEPDSHGFVNASSGLRNAKYATMYQALGLGKGKMCCTYKGWQVIPTDQDFEDYKRRLENQKTKKKKSKRRKRRRKARINYGKYKKRDLSILSKGEREVLLARMQKKEMSPKELAIICGKKEGSAQSLLSRAVSKLEGREMSQERKEKLAEYRKKYREENKDRISEYAKNYMGKYYREHKEEYKRRSREHYIKNREKITEMQKERYLQKKAEEAEKS